MTDAHRWTGAGRAIRPGRHPRRAALALGAALSVPVLLAGCGSSPTPSATYGGAPTFLPAATVPAHRVLDASAAHPQLGIEGDTFAASVGAARGLITMVGPDVPVTGLAPPPQTTAATFTITLIPRSGSIVLRPGEFTIIDGEGHVDQPREFAGPATGGSTAGSAAAGSAGGSQTGGVATPVVVRIHEVLATGPGTIRWAPLGAAVASWDFTVEID